MDLPLVIGLPLLVPTFSECCILVMCHYKYKNIQMWASPSLLQQTLPEYSGPFTQSSTFLLQSKTYPRPLLPPGTDLTDRSHVSSVQALPLPTRLPVLQVPLCEHLSDQDQDFQTLACLRKTTSEAGYKSFLLQPLVHNFPGPQAVKLSVTSQAISATPIL